MHVVIVGCGRVGSGLAQELVRRGHTVGIIDKDPTSFRRLTPDWGGIEVVGVGFDRDHLEAAGASRAGGFVSVSSGDNSNILSARIARDTYRVPVVVARIYDPRRAEIYQRLGISTVATVTWTIQQVLRKLLDDRSATNWTDPTGTIHLVERELPEAWCGKRLGTIEAHCGARIVSVTRRGRAQLGNTDLIGQEGDILHLVYSSGAEDHFEELFGKGPDGQARHVARR
jgi:trk system potassium uptake protein TrkA